MATKGEQTRERILKKATRVFNRQGFGPTTVNDLLKATGTTKGKLYFHFSGKDEIGLEVLRLARGDFVRFLDESLQGQTPGAGLDHFFRKAVEKHRRTGFVGGCLFGNTALETSDSAPQFATLVSNVFTEWVGKLEQTIAAAQAAGQVRRDLPASNLAELVVATLEGAIMQARLKKEETPMVRALETLRILLELKTSISNHPQTQESVHESH